MHSITDKVDLAQVNMNRATIVALYESMPEDLIDLISQLQAAAAVSLGRRFKPRPIGENHVTVIGLDCGSIGSNAQDLRGLLVFLKNAFRKRPLFLQFGGFDRNEPMLSRGELLQDRTLGTTAGQVVLIGWPVTLDSETLNRGRASSQLALIRKACGQYGFVHKYSSDGTSDPDAYMVIGDIVPELRPQPRNMSLRDLTTHLLSKPVVSKVDDNSLTLVEYLDAALPRASSISRPINSLV